MAVSELPGNPNAVWTVRRHVEGMQYFPKTRGGANVFWCVLFVVGGFFWFVGFFVFVFCPGSQERCCMMGVCHPQKLCFESAATCLYLEATLWSPRIVTCPFNKEAPACSCIHHTVCWVSYTFAA